jgi:hypothetical protein
MNNWYVIEREMLRQQAELVVRSRRSSEVPRPSSQGHLSLSERLLRRLGDQLVAWGCRLQSRYSAVTLTADSLLVEPRPSPCSS